MVMQENRSFDHYFGAMSGVKGFSDPSALPGVFQQHGAQPPGTASATGYIEPFPLLEDFNHDGQVLNDPNHSWGPLHQCWNGGKMDSFVSTHVATEGAQNGPIVMGYYDRSTLPFYYALADAFTVLDNYHCSVIGPTYPNRLYWMTGMLDPSGANGGPLLSTPNNDLNLRGKYTWTTMPEALQQAGVSWKVYEDLTNGGPVDIPALNFNMLFYFKNFWDNQGGPLGQRAFQPNYPAGFRQDVANDTLPQVSWVIPSFLQCEHPSVPAAYGENVIAQLLNILVSNPKVWEKTALIISYDENGGFFDHVPPPVAPAGTPGEYITADLSTVPESNGIAGPIGLGFRTPAMIISPYTRGGFVYSGVSDHTSQLRLIESRFGVKVPNLTSWRRQAVGDLTGAFNFAAPANTSVPAFPTTTVAENILITTQLVQNGVQAYAGNGNPYPVPPNQMPTQEATPPRGRPSGPVKCAPSSSA